MIDGNKREQLDFNLLKVFEALYLERNMTTVAKRLFISPSAVSHAVKRLRVALNDELFVRQGMLMQPTSVCARLAPPLIDTLNQLRSVLQTAGEFEPNAAQQTFKIAMPEALEPLLLPQIRHHMLQQAPHVKLISMRLERHEMSRQLSAKIVDAAIDIALPLKHPIKHFMLSSDHFCVLMSKAHPAASGLTKQHYLDSQHVAVSSRASGHVLEDFALLAHGYNREIALRCQSYETAKQCLRDSQLLLTLPSLLTELNHNSSFVRQALPMPLPSVKTHLYWHENSEGDESQHWLRDVIKQSFEYELT